MPGGRGACLRACSCGAHALPVVRAWRHSNVPCTPSGMRLQRLPTRPPAPIAVPPPPLADNVAKLIILNTPLGLKTPLRPELAAYKNPVSTRGLVPGPWCSGHAPALPG